MRQFLRSRLGEKSSKIGILTAIIGTILPEFASSESLALWVQVINAVIGVVLFFAPDNRAASAAREALATSTDPRLLAAVREAGGQGNPPTMRSPAWIGIVAILLTIAACAPTEDREARLARAQAALACAAEISREVQVTAQAEGDNLDKALASAEVATQTAVVSPACQALAAAR